MAVIKNTLTDEKITLQVQHTFGRQAETCNTVLTHANMSRLHAVISWDGDCWAIKDSNSSNGTYRNGNKQKGGVNYPLSKHDKLQFGSLQAECWEILSLDPPKSLLTPLTPGLQTIELDNIAALPSDENPEITLYLNEGGQWLCESAAGVAILQSGDLVGTHDQTWRFIDNKPATKTSTNDGPQSPPEHICYEFDVSQNEEHVSIKLAIDDEDTDLGQRSHHYLLLLLARQRLQDKNQGIAESEQGWINKKVLMKMLGFEETHINIQIYRFRKQLVAALPNILALHNAIERRSGELRLSCANIVIRGGMKIDQDCAQVKHQKSPG